MKHVPHPARPGSAAALVLFAAATLAACTTDAPPIASPTPTGDPPTGQTVEGTTPTPSTLPAPTQDPTPPSTAPHLATPPPTPPPPPGTEHNAHGVAADPDFAAGLRGTRISTRLWKTDFRFHTVPFDEIFSGGVGRDGIPPIDSPRFVSTRNAARWLADTEPVIALAVDGEAKAYPLQVMTWHEIANDVIADVPVAATFCPLCNSAVVFKRTLDGVVHDFGVSGNLRNSDLVMWDRQTETWWQQLTGEGIVGELAGARLAFVPAQIVSWAAFETAYPDGLVLSRETGHTRSYGTNPYAGYDRVDNPPFLLLEPGTGRRLDADPRLLPKERVVAVEINGDPAAFPYARLREERVVHAEVGGERIVVFFEPGTNSALGAARIARADDVGATGVFRPALDGRPLTFRLADDSAEGAIVDAETGSVWSILGAAVRGPLVGRQLDRVAAHDHFWFAWAAFRPGTTIHRGAS